MNYKLMRCAGSCLSAALFFFGLLALIAPSHLQAQTGPTMLDPHLAVRTVVSGLTQPTSMAFIGPSDFFVLEKASGRVRRVTNGVIQATVLDLAVNSGSERGLLGIALHPDFPTDPGVYLYWTESTTGADTANLADVALLGNRVDRYNWNGSTLAFDRNLIRLHAFQNDATNGVMRGNHNGGVISFGPDGKLYILIGDNGRRGQLQNLPCGPTAQCPGPILPDDQFGGPQPDNAHFTGVIIRLNDDGTTPTDNPFFSVGAGMGGEVGANIQRIFAYGLRNSFGMAFDPKSGNLWAEENGDDSFTELNLVEPGMNSGWVQIQGPVDRIAEFKSIETSPQFFGLQQVRWPPTLLADTPEQALSRLFVLPGSHFSDPAAIGFVPGRALGPQFEGDLFMGGARTTLAGGHLFHFNLTGNRKKIGVSDPLIEDKVADNLGKFDITESESLLIGRDFGIGTDIEASPEGTLYVVSNSNGAVYEIFGQK
jgi:aldose sugar dehydrogenase